MAKRAGSMLSTYHRKRELMRSVNFESGVPSPAASFGASPTASRLEGRITGGTTVVDSLASVGSPRESQVTSPIMSIRLRESLQ